MTDRPHSDSFIEAPGSPGWTHRYPVINGVRLHVVDHGSGPLVILLHGFPEFWYAWRHQIPALAAAGFRVLAPDLRGYNTSAKPPAVRDYRLEILQDDVLGLIRDAGETQAIIVGHDWGGAIAWTFAIRYPQAVRQLIVLNAPHPLRFIQAMRTLTQLRKSWYVFFFQLPRLPEMFIRAGHYARLRTMLMDDPVRAETFDSETIRYYQQALDQPGALTAAINYYRALFRYGLPGLGRNPVRLDKPTLLIWGEQDRYLDIALTSGLDRWVSQLTIVRIPSASHWLHAEIPEQINRLMVDAIDAKLDLGPSATGYQTDSMNAVL